MSDQQEPQPDPASHESSPAESTSVEAGPPSTASGPPATVASPAPSARTGQSENNGLPLTERLRLAREAAAAKAVADNNNGQPLTPSTAELNDGSASFANASNRNPKFPPPLSVLLGKNSPVPANASPGMYVRATDDPFGGPPNGLTGPPTQTTPYQARPGYEHAIESPAPAAFRPVDPYHNPNFNPAREGPYSSLSYGRAPYDGQPGPAPFPLPADNSGGYPAELNYGPPPPDSIRDARRAGYDSARPFDSTARGRDARMETPAQARSGRSPDNRDRNDDSRRFPENNENTRDSRDARDDRSRDQRDSRDGRDRQRESRRDDSPRRTSYGTGHHDRRRSRSPPASSAGPLAPKSPEAYVHPSRRTVVEHAASSGPGAYPPPPPSTGSAGVYNRAPAPPSIYSPRMENRPLDRYPAPASSSYPPPRDSATGYSSHSSGASSYDPHGPNKRARDPYPTGSPPPRSAHGSEVNGRGASQLDRDSSRYGSDKDHRGSTYPSRGSGPSDRRDDEQDLKRRRLSDQPRDDRPGHSSSARRDDNRSTRQASPPARTPNGGSLLDRIRPLDSARKPEPYVRRDGRPRPPNWRSRPCSYFIDGKRCPTADECNFRHAFPDDNGCRFFQAYIGGRQPVPCRHGDRCERSHSRDAPCVLNMTPEGCPNKKACGFKHTYYVDAPIEVGKQPQITEYRKTNPRPFPPGERDRLSDGPSTSTLESYRRGPQPSPAPQSVNGDVDGLDPRFSSLIRALSDGRQELCSKAAAQILAIDKAVYHKAGVQNWSSFLGLAQVEGYVNLGRGEVPGREWVQLSDKALAHVPGRSASSTIGHRQPSPSTNGDPARADRQTSQGSRADVEDQLDLTFDDLIGELGLPPPTEEQTAAANKAPLGVPSSDFNGYSSSPTKVASAAIPTTLGASGSGSGPADTDELADLRRQVAKLSQSVAEMTDDLDYERKKRTRAEQRADEAEERAKVLEERWKAARASGK